LRDFQVYDADSRYQAQRFALSRALALAGITTTLVIPLAFYARTTAPSAGSVPIVSADGRGYYLAALFLTIVLAGIIQALETDDPARLVNRYGERLYQYRQPAPRTAWMLPAVGLFAIFLLLALHHSLIIVLLAPFLAGGLVLASRVTRFEVMQGPQAASPLVALAQQALVFVVGAGTLLTLFAFRPRTLYAGPVIFLATMLVFLSLFDGTDAPPVRRFVFASIGGAAVAQVSWALGYWNISTLAGGALLALAFVFYGNLSRVELERGVTRRHAILNVAVAVPVFIFLASMGD
jgi:hypothetical protein